VLYVNVLLVLKENNGAATVNRLGYDLQNSTGGHGWSPETGPHIWITVTENRTQVRKGRSRSPKVVDFGNNRKRVCDFLLVINSNLGPILLRFRDIAGFLLRTATTPNRSEFWDVFLGLDHRC